MISGAEALIMLGRPLHAESMRFGPPLRGNWHCTRIDQMLYCCRVGTTSGCCIETGLHEGCPPPTIRACGRKTAAGPSPLYLL